MNWTISKRLGVGFGALVVFAAGLGALSVWQSLTKSDTIAVQTGLSAMLTEIGQTKEAVLTPRVGINRLMLNPSAEEKQRLEGTIKASQEQIEKLKQLELVGAEKETAEELRKNFNEYVKAASTVATLSLKQDQIFTGQCPKLAQQLETAVTKLASEARSKNRSEIVASAYQMRGYVNQIRLRLTRYVLTGDGTNITDLVEAVKGTEQALADIRKQNAAEFASLVDEIKRDLDAYVVLGTELRATYDERKALQADVLNKIGPVMTKQAVEISKSIMERAKTVEATASTSAGNSLVLSAVATVIIVIIGTLSAFFMSRSITKPLNKVTASLKDIAEGEGDLTQRVDETRKDELGELGKYFNTFVGRIQDLMKEVSATSKQVAAASTEIAASAEQMATGLDKQQAQTQQVSAAMEEMSASVIEVARKSTDACKTAEDAGSQATEGGSVVEKTVMEMKGIADQVTESARSVNNLGKKSEQIGQIISVINDIADQTNLLALNAAIEAARAGEHGRGFAVVADEVRKLAERTTTATEEVARSIREIQTDTGAAVGCIEEGTKKVQSGVQYASNAGEALRRIVQGSENVRQMVQSIAAAAEEQSAAGEQISKSVEQINAVTRESAEGAQQSSKAAAELSKQAELLERLVGRFKV